MLANVDVGVLILRLAVGLVMAAHGAQKLFGWFGGKGMQGHLGAMQRLGLRPAVLWGYLSALAEFMGGLFFALGLLTPLAAAAIVSVMLVAIATVHLSKGFWNSAGGYEWPLMLAIVAFVVGLIGPGVYSLDYVLSLRLPEPSTYIIVLIVALIGVSIVLMQTSAGRGGERRAA